MRSIFFIASTLATLFLLPSCSTRQYQVLFNQKTPVTDTISAKNDNSVVNYRIRPQDLLQIRNLQNISYIVDAAPSGNGASTGGSGQVYQVDDEGMVALPVIGHVAVAGLTRAQATKLVEDLYRKTLLKDPIIELKITNLKITMLGEVGGQGNFPLIKDRTTLVEMIGQAGGLTKNANETNVKIIRGEQQNQQVITINLRDINSINDPRAILQSGDIVYVSQSKRAVRNDNLQNISTVTQPVLLLLNTALLILSFSRR